MMAQRIRARLPPASRLIRPPTAAPSLGFMTANTPRSRLFENPGPYAYAGEASNGREELMYQRLKNHLDSEILQLRVELAQEKHEAKMKEFEDKNEKYKRQQLWAYALLGGSVIVYWWVVWQDMAASSRRRQAN